MTSTLIQLPELGSPFWKDAVASASDLPADNNAEGYAIVANDTQTLYVWHSGSWVAVATPGAAIALDGLIGDGTASGPGVATLTLATVNANVGTFTKVTVNGKGLVVAATTLSASDIPALSYLPISGGTLTGALSLTAGTVSAASVNFGTANTGIYAPTASTLALTISGAEVGRWTSTGLNINSSGTTGVMNVQQYTDGVTNGIRLYSQSGLHDVCLSVYNNNTAFLYSGLGNDQYLTFLGQKGGTGNFSPSYHWDVGYSDAGTSPTGVTLNALAITNHDLTLNNLSPILFVSGTGGQTSGIVGVHESHTSNAGTGHIELFTAISGVKSTKAILSSVGQLALQASGTGLSIKEGTDCKQGVVTLVGGSAVVSNTSVTANSRIFITSQADGGTPGWLRVSTRTAGTSFTITSSSGSDTSTVAYFITEPS